LIISDCGTRLCLGYDLFQVEFFYFSIFKSSFYEQSQIIL
jgi:hypothetical protein